MDYSDAGIMIIAFGVLVGIMTNMWWPVICIGIGAALYTYGLFNDK